MNIPTQTQINFNHLIRFRNLSSTARVNYFDLYPYQKDMLGNGCGPKGWGAVPDLGLTQACNEHDFLYWRGGRSKDRLQADQMLLGEMLWYAGTHKSLLRRVIRRVLAWGYYTTIRIFGGLFWNYRPFNARDLLHQTRAYFGY